MAKHRWSALLCASAAVAWAIGCGDDEPLEAAVDAGRDAQDSGPDGPDSSGATGGTAGSGGAGGSGGGSGSGGTAGGAGADGGGGEPLNPRGVAVVTPAGADAGAAPALLLAMATDYATKSELTAVDLETRNVRRTTFDDGDAVPAASGGIGFVLERTNDEVHVLDATGGVARTIDVRATPSGGSPARKAYILLYATNRIAVADLDAGRVVKHIDLSAFHLPQDADGSVDMDDVVFDSGAGRAYVVLGRIDRTTIAAPSFELGCPTWKGLVVGIDTTSDAVIDLNGTASGEAVELSLVSPSGMHFDSAADRLLVLHSGCVGETDAGRQRMHHGVEAVSLSAGTSQVVLPAESADFLNRLIVVGGGEALINSFDGIGEEHWQRWTISQASLGAELTGVPLIPSYDGAYGLLGPKRDNSAELVRYAIDSGTTTTIVADAWSESFPAIGGTALVD